MINVGATFDPLPFLLTVAFWLLAAACVVGMVLLIRTMVRRHAALARIFDTVVLQVLVPKEGAEQSKPAEQGIEKIHEAIAKTEAFFGSLGGLRAQRGWRVWWTGRGDHLAFEVVAHRGQIKFFIAVPRAYQEYLEQQLHAQEPHAYIEEAKDYNIFSPSGVIVGTTLTFKRPVYFPVKTYKELDSDPLNALTNAMSKVAETEGAAVQYVVRSARKEWRSGGVRIASKMQQGKTLDEAMHGGGFWSAVGKGFSAASGKKKEEASPSKEHRLSPMEEKLVKGLEEKASKSGLDVNIRVVVAAADIARATLHLQGIAQSFAQYNIYQYGNMFVSGKPNGELNLERIGDRPCDFVLECKCTVQLAVISFRPNAKTVSRVDQFGCHTNMVALALQTSFEHISNVEFFSDLLCVLSFQ